MSECDDLTSFLNGAANDMLLEDAFRNANFSTDVKEEKCDGYFGAELHGNPMDWNPDLNYDASDQFKNMLSEPVFPDALNGDGDFNNMDNMDTFLNDVSFSGDLSFPLVDVPCGTPGNNTLLSGYINLNNTQCAQNKNNNSSVYTNTLLDGLIADNKINRNVLNDGQSCLDDNLLDTLSMDQIMASKDSIDNVSTMVTLNEDDLTMSQDTILSPTHSSSSSDSSDSGVSTGEAGPLCTNLEQQLSPEPIEPVYNTEVSSTSDFSTFTSPPLTYPHSSGSSGYSSSTSSSTSPSSSPTNPSSPPSIIPLSPTSSSVNTNGITLNQYTNNLTTTTVPITNCNPATTTTVTPQFYVQKRSNCNKLTTNGGNINRNTINGLSNKQTITLVSAQSHPNTIINNINTINTSRIPQTITTTTINGNNITPTIINRSQLHSSKHFKSSPSPSVVTLSGVNKTAGIIKSPSVVNMNRKQNTNVISVSNFSTCNNATTSSSSSISGSTHKPISVISSNGELVSTNVVSNPNIYKTVTVSNANGRLSTAASNGQIIIAPRSAVATLANGATILKSSQNSSLYIPIATKDIDKLRTIKIISNRDNGSNNTITTNAGPLNTSNATLFRTTNGIRTIVSTANRHRQNGMTGISAGSNSNGLRTTNMSILKNINVMNSKSLQTIKESNGFLTIPKEENDSDDDIELPKNNQPLNLSDEEKKLATKEKIKFPSHYPLNKMQERELKRIKRKIRNKISAQDSRKRKKEYMDKLEEKIDASHRENDRLKGQLAVLEETNQKLSEQLKKFQMMMNEQNAPPSVNSNSGSSHNGRQHPSTFLMMMILSVALFIYPSVLPPGRTTDLLASVAHKMPQAGNSRSLLEAATKMSVCQDDCVEDDIDVESKPSIAALTDHDYTPPSKRGRFDLALRDNYCMPMLDDHLPPPRKKDDGSGGGRGGIGGSDSGGGGSTPPPDGPASPDDPMQPSKQLRKEEQVNPAIKLEPNLLTKFSLGVIDSMLNQLEGNSNRSETDASKPLDSLSQSLVVELATTGTKRFREDIELE